MMRGDRVTLSCGQWERGVYSDAPRTITGTLRTVDKERGIVAVWSAQGQRPNGSSCEMIFHRDINAVTPLKKEGN